MRRLVIVGVAALFGACRGSEAAPAARASPMPSAAAAAATTSAAPAGQDAGFRPASAALPSGVTWPASPSAERLDRRFAPPAGFTRVDVASGSFGAMLRALPLLPPDARVVDHAGRPLYQDGRHPRIAAVVDIDVGARDLQQCADTVIRLHAEWRYGSGDRTLSYRAASGVPLAYEDHLAGRRPVLDGGKLALVAKAPPSRDDRVAFRAWLDEVFAWANTASLARDAEPVTTLAEVQAGDFFVMSGRPFGHAVLVADVARDPTGRLALLLVQGFMPAQSAHVLRATDESAWFVLAPGASEIVTPFWAPFPMSSLRRLATAAPPPASRAPTTRARACMGRHYDLAGATWDDGRTKTARQRIEGPDVQDMLAVPYPTGPITPVTRDGDDPGRARVEAIFRATYGANAAQVSAALVDVPVRGRTVKIHRRAADALRRVAARLDRAADMDPSIDRAFAVLGGTFATRSIAGTNRTSAHAWGIAIDLDPSLGDYWRDSPRPTWKNRVPERIVEAFEAEGFAWGGRWFHFDTMHFEYRPELFDSECRP